MKTERNLTGQCFGRLTVLRKSEELHVSPKGRKSRQWVCRCVCGKEVTVQERNLISGDTRSCGCLKLETLNKFKKDLTGQRFGRLTVLHLSDERYVSPSGKCLARKWVCKCDCGNIVTVMHSSLTSGATKSCGCLQKENVTHAKNDLTGQRYGRWTVLGRAKLAHPTPQGEINGWLCKCDCGTERIVLARNLVGGKSTSCGCLSVEKATDRIDPEKENVLGCYMNTHICQIQPGKKPNKNNTSGTRGVYWSNHEKKWIAYIGIQRKRIILGRFANIEDAIAARKAGEEEYFIPIIQDYENRKK